MRGAKQENNNGNSTMNDTTMASAVLPPPPSTRWVRFLRNYGPLPTNGNLFDEYVHEAVRRASVAPVVLSSPHLEEMIVVMTSAEPCSILIAGTAGDGKTFHCRSLWAALGGSPTEWSAPGKVKTLTALGGRSVVFVTDLSALLDTESDDALEGLERSVSSGDGTITYVVATNHGQILERLRGLGARRGRVSPLRKPIQDVFLQASGGVPRLRVFDLSRTAYSRSLKEVLDAVTGHPGWESCQDCTFDSGARVCPIAENRRRVVGADDGGRLVGRLGDLVEISRLNGSHLPIRDLLALAANMLLGHPDAKDGLMTCADVPKIQDAGTIELAAVYDNVFGSNLPGRRAFSGSALPVFRALSSFGIGEETTNGIDGLLVYGTDDTRLSGAFAAVVGSDPVYGATPVFKALQERYLEGEEEARLDDGAAAFMERLSGQRRRLFFTLPAAREEYPFWSLTAFRFAGDYLDLIESLAARRPVDDKTRARLAKGLNRVMTGLLLDNHDKLFVASSGGFTQSKISVLCETEVPGRRSGGIGMSIRHDALAQRPCLDVVLAPGGGAVTFGLAPVRFEFLCRVAEGALPGSFSNECLEDLLAFKARLLRQSELARLSAAACQGDEVFEEEGSLVLTFIEIEHTGHGYSKPVSVRTTP